MNLHQPYPFLLKNAVSADVLDHVTLVTIQHWSHFKTNETGEVAGRKFLVVDFVAPDRDRLLFDVKQTLAAQFDLGEYRVPPGLKDFINVISEGGHVHPHTDPDEPGRRHVRINVVVKQTEGCVPLLDDVPMPVERGDAWLNLASICRHATTAAEGPGYRSVISFGFQIGEQRGRELEATYRQWLADVRETADSGNH
jgi:hypothetical protein